MEEEDHNHEDDCEVITPPPSPPIPPLSFLEASSRNNLESKVTTPTRSMKVIENQSGFKSLQGNRILILPSCENFDYLQSIVLNCGGVVLQNKEQFQKSCDNIKSLHHVVLIVDSQISKKEWLKDHPDLNAYDSRYETESPEWLYMKSKQTNRTSPTKKSCAAKNHITKEEEEEEEEGEEFSKSKRKNEAKDEERKKRFGFMCDLVSNSEYHKGNEIFLNDRITSWLERLKNIRETEEKKEFNIIAYTKAISIIKKYPFQITLDNLEEFANNYSTRGIGKKLRERIREILETGKLEEVEKKEETLEFQAINAFIKIWGVGIKTAKSLIKNHGIVNINQLKERQDLLTQRQKYGLEFYDDFQTRMDRDEIKAIRKIVQDAAFELFGMQIKLEVCGSYRRMKPTSGDIDIIISYQDESMRDMVPDLKSLVSILHEKHKLLVADLTSIDELDEVEGNIKKQSYMGVCKLPEDQVLLLGKGTALERRNRRIDIKTYPLKVYAFALLYFTGSGYFNRSMRLKARRMFGLSLSDTGLSKVFRSTSSSEALRYSEGSKIGERIKSDIDMFENCDTEEKIFQALKIEFVPPELRDEPQISLESTNEDEDILDAESIEIEHRKHGIV